MVDLSVGIELESTRDAPVDLGHMEAARSGAVKIPLRGWDCDISAGNVDGVQCSFVRTCRISS